MDFGIEDLSVLDVTPCLLVTSYRYFERYWYLHAENQAL